MTHRLQLGEKEFEALGGALVSALPNVPHQFVVRSAVHPLAIERVGEGEAKRGVGGLKGEGGREARAAARTMRALASSRSRGECKYRAWDLLEVVRSLKESKYACVPSCPSPSLLLSFPFPLSSSSRMAESVAGAAAPPPTSSGPSPPLSLKVSGALSGAVLLPSGLHTTCRGLRREIARLLGNGALPSALLLFASGKSLPDSEESTLASRGIIASSKLLVTLGASAAPGLRQAEEQSSRLDRLSAAAAAIAARDGDAAGGDAPSFELENQAGDAMVLSEADRRALVQGLALHGKGKSLLASGRWADALDVLLLAESSLALCLDDVVRRIDNVPLMKLEIVWCAFRLRDAARLASAGVRLREAREGLARAHGPDLARLRVLQGGFRPELAVYLRLELLEGVFAHHSGAGAAAAAEKLKTAGARLAQLAVSDQALAAVMELGVPKRDALRGLRFTGGDANAAYEWAAKAEAEEAERKAARRARRAEKKRRAPFSKGGGPHSPSHLSLSVCSRVSCLREIMGTSRRFSG